MATLIVLNPGEATIQSVDAHTGTVEVLVAGAAAVPDGLIVDEAAGVMYWTNMGLPAGSSAASSLTGIAPFNEVNGSLERARMDGSERAFILPPGSFVTGKQLAADFAHGWLYFADREGMRLFRVGVDGTGPQVLVQNGDYAVASEQADELRHCVGVAIDPVAGLLYWTQKGPNDGGCGRILRAPARVPADPSQRNDIETLWEGLPEPIDLCLDRDTNTIYWTDRGAEPEGNTLNRAPIPALGKKGEKPTILASRFREPIGLDRDCISGSIYVTDLAGNIREINVERGIDRLVATLTGTLTGIAVIA